MDGELPDDLDELMATTSPQDIVQMIEAVVRRGLRFDRDYSSVGGTARRLMHVVHGDAAIRIARRAVDSRVSRGVCLDFATAMQVLFFAVKTATRALSQTFLVSILGRAIDFGRYLAAAEFERVVPDWRDELARRDAQRGVLGRLVVRADRRDDLICAALR